MRSSFNFTTSDSIFDILCSYSDVVVSVAAILLPPLLFTSASFIGLNQRKKSHSSWSQQTNNLFGFAAVCETLMRATFWQMQYAFLYLRYWLPLLSPTLDVAIKSNTNTR
ncbi:uncharacterized protein G2W53_012368 [Senna tora]|uniref:Uncharacterized protein n=1 Tax=Senna tora TaxID=362788 RepID=A0A834WQQ4_9FABA|nr:uncharacterized protein G2W53_038238 [Senna tora]KAF7828276.1 uncharacterized protein G2W53_019440 [Senna tora]KAF7830035.1 uncharacterized protein G2W53_012368 [Senna tora]